MLEHVSGGGICCTSICPKFIRLKQIKKFIKMLFYQLCSLMTSRRNQNHLNHINFHKRSKSLYHILHRPFPKFKKLDAFYQAAC
jgi:hypothetical protein